MAEFIKNPKNSYLFGALALFVTVYGPRLSPKLPQPIQNLFENAFFRASVMFLAIYVAQRDIMVSLVVTIVFMVLMNVVQTSQKLIVIILKEALLLILSILIIITKLNSKRFFILIKKRMILTLKFPFNTQLIFGK